MSSLSMQNPLSQWDRQPRRCHWSIRTHWVRKLIYWNGITVIYHPLSLNLQKIKMHFGSSYKWLVKWKPFKHQKMTQALTHCILMTLMVPWIWVNMVQVMACCLTASSHYLKSVQGHSPERYFTKNANKLNLKYAFGDFSNETLPYLPAN